MRARLLLVAICAMSVGCVVEGEHAACFTSNFDFASCCCPGLPRAKFATWCWDEGRSPEECCATRECDCGSAGPFCAWQGVWRLEFVDTWGMQRLSISAIGEACYVGDGFCDWLVHHGPADEPGAQDCTALLPVYSGASLHGPLNIRHHAVVQRMKCEQSGPGRQYIAAQANLQLLLQHLFNLPAGHIPQLREIGDELLRKFQHGFGVCVDPGCRLPEARAVVHNLVQNFVLADVISTFSEKHVNVGHSIDFITIHVDPNWSAEPWLECFQTAELAQYCCGANSSVSDICWRAEHFNWRSCCVPVNRSLLVPLLSGSRGNRGVRGIGRAQLYTKRGRVVLQLMVSGLLWLSICDGPGQCSIARGVREQMAAADFQVDHFQLGAPNRAILNHEPTTRAATTDSCTYESLHGTSASGCFDRFRPLALNAIDGDDRPHHAALVSVALPLIPGILMKDVLLDVNGLQIPYRFDCAEQWSGADAFEYYYFTPSRWHACHLHEAHLRSGLRKIVPQLPVIDDEYAELVAVYDSVLQANSSFIFIEIGARWGTWGARALAALNRIHPNMPRKVLFVEALQPHCAGIREVMQLNAMGADYELLCRDAEVSDLSHWIESNDHVDVIDLDVQSAELDLLPAMKHLLDERVHRVICATHSHSIHASMSKLFSDWIKIDEVPFTIDGECANRYVRGFEDPSHPDRFNWQAAKERGCLHSTPFGPIIQHDGMLIVDNPRFFRDPRSHLSMATTLPHIAAQDPV